MHDSQEFMVKNLLNPKAQPEDKGVYFHFTKNNQVEECNKFAQ